MLRGDPKDDWKLIHFSSSTTWTAVHQSHAQAKGKSGHMSRYSGGAPARAILCRIFRSVLNLTWSVVQIQTT